LQKPFLFYELTNHLGNVTTVFGEDLTNYEILNDNTTTYQAPSIRSYKQYTPFGLNIEIAENSPYSGLGTYRYGFNGKENDEDGEFGNATHYDYGFRIYNPTIARFLSVDPLAPDYPWNSPYSFAENDVLRAIDLDGAERAVVINRYTNGRLARTTIQVVSDNNGLVNLNATGIDQGGNVIGGLTMQNILEINVGGNLPLGVNPTNIRQNFNANERAIIAAGVDNSRTLIARPPSISRTANNSDALSAVGGISFPGSRPQGNQNLNSVQNIGRFQLVPIFQTQTVQQPVVTRVPFPTQRVGNNPLAIVPGTGQVMQNPANNAGFAQVRQLFQLAQQNNLTSLNVNIQMPLGSTSTLNINALQNNIASNLQSTFGFTGNINVNVTPVQPGPGQGGVTISSPGGLVNQVQIQNVQQQVQVGTQNQLNPN